MKEIKFRAWNRVHQFMMEWDDFLDYEADQMAIVGNDYRIFNDDEFELLQYTGFKDRNGKEVYEGDICKIYFDVDNVEDWVYQSLTKNERETGMKIFQVESPLFNNQTEFTADVIEVIGNIYENYELLEEA